MREDQIRGLRDLADWLEAHPDAKFTGISVQEFAWNRDDFVDGLRAMGSADKAKEGSFMVAKKDFAGGITYTLNVTEREVCERVQVGTKVVKVPDPDAPMIDKIEPQYEYRCPESLLAPEKKEVLA